MIKVFVFSLIALGAGVYFQLLLADDPGYVLVSFKSYDIESTLGTAVLSLLVGFVVFYGVVWLIKALNPFSLFNKNSWLVAKRRKNGLIGTEKGLRLLLLGEWQRAYKLLVENADKADNPMFNYLAASVAAFQHGDKTSWSYCLDQAQYASADSTQAIKILRAQMELKSGQLEQSLETLLALKKEVPNNPVVLKGIKDVCLQAPDWDRQWDLLPELEKNKVLSRDEMFTLTEKATVFRIDQAANKDDSSELTQVWENTPKQVKKNKDITLKYVQRLIEKTGNGEEAVGIITSFLKSEWSDELVGLLGCIESDVPNERLLLLEGYVKDRPNDAVLTLALGRVSLRNQLWDQARGYFEKALTFSNDAGMSAEINAELARLLQKLGESEKSIECYDNAINLLDKKLPDLPMPAQGD